MTLTTMFDQLHARGVRLRDKRQATWQLVIDALLRVLTFGGQARYLTSYVTTIGRTIWLPDGFRDLPPESQVITLRHETVHLDQQDRYGLLWFQFLYLVAPLPIFFSWYRYRFEREAYRETIRATYQQYGLVAIQDGRLEKRLVDNLTGPSYCWAWFSRRDVEAWYRATVDEILQDECRTRSAEILQNDRSNGL